MPFKPDQLRVERFFASVSYHAAYSYWNLRGVIAERWAHGPYFGAYADVGDAVRLSAGPETSNAPLIGVYGLKGGSFHGEGAERTRLALQLAPSWFDDIYTAFEPRRTIRISHDLMALYPLRDDGMRASRRLRIRFYNDAELIKVVPERFGDEFHAAVEGIALDADPPLSWTIGVYGPPHAHLGFFNFPDSDRDSSWWMAVRTHSSSGQTMKVKAWRPA